ncbi:MAG: hypothetical protein LBK82_12130 [Planctomycetaceae bacterium]|jgi:capsular polysaccharide biosynthesis protein|nr:hypothetical protein [Planctomycetaceae bacterium]
MLQNEETPETVETPLETSETLCQKTKQTKIPICRKLRIVLGFFVLLVVLGVLFCVLRPSMYTATAYIQILSHKPYFIYDEKQQTNYDNFVNTQFAIIKSPLILSKALEDPQFSQLPIIKSRQDKIAWLARKLELQRLQNSEIITVSITLPVPEDTEKIVNSVVTAFFDFYATHSRDWNFKLLTQLNLELNRQKATARLLQDEIRSGMEQAAKQGGISRVPDSLEKSMLLGESVLRELYLNESKLETLQTELDTLCEPIPLSELEIPETVIQKAVENDPMMKMLQQRKIDLQDHLATLKKDFTQDNNFRILGLQKQIKEIEEKIEEKKKNTEEIKKKFQSEYAQNLETKIIETQLAVRSQTNLVNNLRKKYQEQIIAVGERTVKIVDTQFLQDQLRRVNSIIDQLELRVVAIETERFAPPQIELKRKATIPIQPNPGWGWW